MGIEFFERAIEGNAVLLKAETGGAVGTQPAKMLVLTFDVGCIELHVDPARKELAITHVKTPEQSPHDLADVTEQEPWWRLVGCPLARVWSAGDVLRGGLCLQFREDDKNPRIVTLEPRDARVSVRLENPPGLA